MILPAGYIYIYIYINICVCICLCIYVYLVYIRSLDPPPTVSLAGYSYKSCLVYIPVIVSLFGPPIA